MNRPSGELQELVVGRYEPKKVDDGHEPHEVLYDVVMHAPELLHFHIGSLVSVKATSIGDIAFFSHSFSRKKKKNNLKIEQHGGGELLTRCPGYIPRNDIGKAFGLMLSKQMAEMFPHLLIAQLEFVRTLERRAGTYYSINVECVGDGMSGAWDDVCKILMRYGDLPVNLEIKENARFSFQDLRKLADVCRHTGFNIYIDDLGTSCHGIEQDLQEKKSYLIMLITVLHQYIKAVKVDYVLMKDIARHWPTFEKVKRNLAAFLWYWNGHCDSEPPAVVFESMPVKSPIWIRHLESIAVGYPSGCVYQTDDMKELLDNNCILCKGRGRMN